MGLGKCRERPVTCEFPLEKTKPKLRGDGMLPALRRLFRRPPIRLGLIARGQDDHRPLRTAGFVSFFQGEGCATRPHPDLQDRRLRRQRRLRWATTLTVLALSVWFVIESAQALAMF
jgi:hypothetical protein